MKLHFLEVNQEQIKYTLCSEKTPTHIFFCISMNDVWIKTKIAVNVPKQQ